MILIVDFGGQYTSLIARGIRETNLIARVINPEAIGSECPAEVRGVILSGSPAAVNEPDVASVRALMGWKMPTLGICYGHQLLAAAFGGAVAEQSAREYGRAMLRQTRASPLWKDIPAESPVWMSHGDSVTHPPGAGWETLGVTEEGAHAAVGNASISCFGVQFHPEVTQTAFGARLLQNFLFGVCGCVEECSPVDLKEPVLAHIRDAAGREGNVLIACSLGVDSSTLAFACREALGADRVYPVFVDNGLLRDEDRGIAEAGREALPNLRIVNAGDEFLAALRYVSHPKKKRTIVGETFWRVFTPIARELREQRLVTAFLQGTIAPDVIESGRASRRSDVIKPHHNLVPIPPDFPFVPVEPLKDLFKDQVRVLGVAVGVPPHFLSRHPFPGPGLAVRVRGPVTPERLKLARESDAIFIGELRRAGLYDRVSQALVGIGMEQYAGVRGDARAGGSVATLRAVVTRDFMTADVADLPVPFLADVGDRIVNRVRGISYVAYSTTRKPPGTIEFE